MQNRHKSELLKRLERIADLGTCEIRATELRRWFGRERLTKNVWAEILDHWSDISGNDEIGLLVASQDGTYVFIYNDGLAIKKSDWWNDLSTWANSESGR